MKKSFYVYLYNRIEKIGKENFNHIGCEGIKKDCGEVLSEFVPNIGDRVKVRFTIEREGIKKKKDDRLYTKIQSKI